MNFSSLNDTDKLLLSRMDDFIMKASEKYTTQYSHFLDERQALLCTQYLKSRMCSNYMLWGGHENAERAVLGIFADFEDPENEAFPIAALTFTYRKEDQLSHRDFLGALMNLMIKRESIGDILVGEGLAVVFIQRKLASLVINEVTKIGRTGVKIQEDTPLGLPEGKGFVDLSGTVSSLRLDCIISLITKLSREKAADLIKSGSVSVMFSPCEDITFQVEQGTKISIRGYGRFILAELGGHSKKGRLHVTCKKYL